MLWIVYREIHYYWSTIINFLWGHIIMSLEQNEWQIRRDLDVYYKSNAHQLFEWMKETRKSAAKRLMPITKRNQLNDGNTHNLYVSHRFKCQRNRMYESEWRPCVCWSPFGCTYIFKLQNNVMRITLNNSEFHVWLVLSHKRNDEKRISTHLISLVSPLSWVAHCFYEYLIFQMLNMDSFVEKQRWRRGSKWKWIYNLLRSGAAFMITNPDNVAFVRTYIQCVCNVPIS